MPQTTFFDRFYQLCRSHGTSPNAVGRLLGIPSGSITAWKQGAQPRPATLNKLAEHFDVSLDFLLGKNEYFTVTDEELKFALFGGDRPISDEMLQEVRNFAEFLKSRNP